MVDNNFLKKISFLRREYLNNKLNKKKLFAHPIDLFEIWLKEAFDAKLPDPNAMCLATVDQNQQPYQRMVLLKDFNQENMIFYTNFNSKKGRHLEQNSKTSLLFYWNSLDRQIIVTGKAKKIAIETTKAYFYSRPRNSQISSFISPQSKRIQSRTMLEKKFFIFKKKFYKKQIPLPKFWGGYSIAIKIVEFWQGGKYRLHDRFLYRKKKKNWIFHRLAP